MSSAKNVFMDASRVFGYADLNAGSINRLNSIGRVIVSKGMVARLFYVGMKKGKKDIYYFSFE